MKINKKKLEESLLETITEDTDIAENDTTEEIPSIDDISSADIDEIATAVQAAAEEARRVEAERLAKEQAELEATIADLKMKDNLTDEEKDMLDDAVEDLATPLNDGIINVAAATAVAGKILAGDAKALEGYFEFLKGGCSMTPIELLKLCGLDMEKPDVVNEALDVFETLLDELAGFIDLFEVGEVTGGGALQNLQKETRALEGPEIADPLLSKVADDRRITGTDGDDW